MANVKISALSAAATLDGSEVLPVVQSAATVKATVTQIKDLIVALIVDSAPGTLDTLNELAAALGDDANFATTMTTALSGKSATTHNHTGTYEPSGTVATHAAAGDPHTGYQKESEKDQASGYAGLTAGTLVATAQLGSGSADATVFLRGDRAWAAPSGGSASHDLYQMGLVR